MYKFKSIILVVLICFAPIFAWGEKIIFDFHHNSLSKRLVIEGKTAMIYESFDSGPYKLWRQVKFSTIFYHPNINEVSLNDADKFPLWKFSIDKRNNEFCVNTPLSYEDRFSTSGTINPSDYERELKKLLRTYPDALPKEKEEETPWEEQFNKLFGIEPEKTQSQSQTKPAQKSAPAMQSKPTSARISKVTIQKGLVVNGEPSIQVDVSSLLKNFKGRKLHFELFFCDADGKNIVNDGDAVDNWGNKYFKSQDFTVTDDNLNKAWWWKVYLKRLNIPRGASKITAFVSVNDENGACHGSFESMTINLNNSSPDVYTKP